jgi:heme iron utilization protein
MHMLVNPDAVKLEPQQLARLARMTLRSTTEAFLIQSVADAAPTTRRVRTACCHDGAPLLQFDKAGSAEPVTLLAINETAGLSVGIQGSLLAADGHGVERFFRRHTEAEATDASVGVFRLSVSGVYVETDDGDHRPVENYLMELATGDLQEAEAGIVEHVNGGHPDTIHAILSHRGLGADDWVMTGADPEGIDVARGWHTTRIAFDTPVHSRDAFKMMMIALRAAGGGAAPPKAAAAE